MQEYDQDPVWSKVCGIDFKVCLNLQGFDCLKDILQISQIIDW